MSPVLVNQIAGLLRIGLPAVIGFIVGRGWLPAELAGPVVDAAAFLGAVIVSGALDLISNRAVAVVKQAASQQGVTVEVNPNAASAIRDVALDPAVHGVVPVK